LLNLTQEERMALSRGDVTCLSHLIVEKKVILDELASLEDEKFDALNNIGISSTSDTSCQGSSQLVDFLVGVDREEANRLLHIQEGTLVLMGRVRDVTLVNRSLAQAAVQQASNMQENLLMLFRRALDSYASQDDYYDQRTQDIEPIEISSFGKEQMALPEIFAAIIQAQDAINADDPRAVASAIRILKNAIEGITGYLELEDMPSIVVTKSETNHPMGDFANEALSQGRSSNIVEQIARLYRQESAYQASIEVNNQMLALV
jgi:flagellar biosynthesis/type III secretory pathway chaperone